ncbi:hypothetical protein [Methylocystis iwaonis]|uniref:hypothetical protein n=1 Tax=Methylocystis iwaonis TaxID=2885079 RepID=UPI002E7AB297|nr:hypothetical protein [Methylocystis iwaonis]
MAGKPIAQIVVTHEAGRDGFWLARFLMRRGLEARVMQAEPAGRSSGHQAKTDAIDAEMLLRTLLAWLRRKPRVCSMIPVPSEADMEARARIGEDLIGERRSLRARSLSLAGFFVR